MLKNTITFLAMLICLSCNSNSNSVITIHSGNQIESNENLSYKDFLRQVDIEKGKLRAADTKKIKDYLFFLFNNDIPKYWSGTPWDFNGTTRTPKQGVIACGYFVTNTLSDMGFSIQRTKLAQVASSQMIKTLCVDVKTISGFDAFVKYIHTQPSKSIFIVGLDFHTGYILKDEMEIYFLHSNYIDREGVVKEKIENSRALQNSKTYVIGSLSENKFLLEKWVKQ